MVAEGEGEGVAYTLANNVSNIVDETRRTLYSDTRVSPVSSRALSERTATMPINTAATLEKWKRNAAAATADIQRGVQSVTTAPTQLAAQQVNKYLTNVQDAVTSGRYVNALNRVTLQDWQNAMLNKGLRNYTNGVQNISASAQKAMADQQQYAEQVKNEIASMPKTTEQDAEDRAIAAIRKMRAYGKRS